ncbi:hypothetical protein, partial [Thermonema rossianum]|uniref:hypothetical protein n=1 Tax=Thermonema rossianum TaxID=55505 RepID=UPI001B80B42A
FPTAHLPLKEGLRRARQNALLFCFTALLMKELKRSLPVSHLRQHVTPDEAQKRSLSFRTSCSEVRNLDLKPTKPQEAKRFLATLEMTRG